MDINMNIRIHSKNNGYIYNLKSNYQEMEKESIDSSDMTRMEEIRKRKLKKQKIYFKFNTRLPRRLRVVQARVRAAHSRRRRGGGGRTREACQRQNACYALCFFNG